MSYNIEHSVMDEIVVLLNKLVEKVNYIQMKSRENMELQLTSELQTKLKEHENEENNEGRNENSQRSQEVI